MSYLLQSPSLHFAGRAAKLPAKCRNPHPNHDRIISLFKSGVSRKKIAEELKTSGERINATLHAAGIDLTANNQQKNVQKPSIPLEISSELLAILPSIRIAPRLAQKELIFLHSEGRSARQLKIAFDEFMKPNNWEAYKPAVMRQKDEFTSSIKDYDPSDEPTRARSVAHFQ
jgi:hypothetical protein